MGFPRAFLFLARTRPCGDAFDKSACGLRRRSLTPSQQNRSPTMVAIYTILTFLVVIFALNRFEFGRFD
ncbi:hypothetical protein [Phenylobacterium ferrooxidans]|uniref:Photosystem II reaction center protein T n=1 Tax=Phenylobacterium ferrooxidans TaxID=2982689 RepID=A0ABW6CSL9_9CAUL